MSLYFSQEKIDHGVLIRWTKGFGAGATEGRDVAAMFRQSLEKYVRVSSLASSHSQSHLAVHNLEIAYHLDGFNQRHNGDSDCLSLCQP